MFQISTAVAPLLAAVLVGFACSSSGLKTIAHDGGGHTIGPSGGGGTSTGGTTGAGGQGGTAGSSTGQGGCAMIMYCGPGYQEIDGPCPAERQCHYIEQPCTDNTTVCVVSQDAGVDAGTSDASSSNGDSRTGGISETGGTGGQGPICAAYPRCNPGDQQVGTDCPSGRKCYSLGVSCGSVQNTIICAYGADAGVDAATPDAGLDVRTMRPCGNGVLDPGEQCDDGNTNNGDGCSATCQIEAGRCPPIPGQTCIGLPLCGNGILTSNEACDDGNTGGGDGCSGDCQTIEPGWQCRVPGKPCIRICGNQLDGSVICDGGSDQSAQCGDGILETGEECDCGDGTIPVPGGCPGPNNDNTYGGCTTKCTWGTFCGDGIVNGPEQCDLGKLNGSDLGPNGCTFGCTKPRSYYCGDGIVETNEGEECDLGKLNGMCLDANGNPTDARSQGNPGDAGCPLGSWDFDGTQVCNCPAGTQVLCTTTCTLPGYIGP